MNMFSAVLAKVQCYLKGGVDGPAGPANAGPLSVIVRSAGALFQL